MRTCVVIYNPNSGNTIKKRNIKNVPVLYSKEENVTKDIITNEEKKRHIPGSVSFVPSVAGLLLSSYVIKELLK